jgi:hypothetical protein
VTFLCGQLRSTSSLTSQAKQGHNFSIARFFRQLSKRLSVYISTFAKVRKAFQKSPYPSRIPSLNRISKVAELDAKVPSSLPQIFDGPTCWRRPKPAISPVDLRSSIQQQLYNFARPIKRRIVNWGCSRFVVRVHKFAVLVQNCLDLLYIPSLYGRDQFV